MANPVGKAVSLLGLAYRRWQRRLAAFATVAATAERIVCEFVTGVNFKPSGNR